MRFLTALALAAPLVSAIQFTAPAVNSTIVKGSDYDLTWSTVDTDPTTFSVYLVNFVNWPPSYVQLKTGIETSTRSTKVHIPCDTASTYGFQFNAINGTNLYVIYAQSPKFSVGGKDCVEPPKPTNATTCAKETTTVYVTVSSSPLNSTVTPTSAPLYPTTSSKCSHGTVPNTIGWSSGYSNPVTLTSVPTPGQPSGTPPPMKTTAGPASPEKDVTMTMYNTIYAPASDCPCKA
jgi:Ser-Thr-rich glycosyl-phosphatidyl-inositol-anchored membrane family